MYLSVECVTHGWFGHIDLSQPSRKKVVREPPQTPTPLVPQSIQVGEGYPSLPRLATFTITPNLPYSRFEGSHWPGRLSTDFVPGGYCTRLEEKDGSRVLRGVMGFVCFYLQSWLFLGNGDRNGFAKQESFLLQNTVADPTSQTHQFTCRKNHIVTLVYQNAVRSICTGHGDS